MSDDWARKYIEVYNREQQEKQHREQEAQARRRLAEDGAREKFHQRRERVNQDVQTLRGGVAFHSMEFDEPSEMKFTVISRGAPRVELQVDLNVTTIRCEYTFSSKDNPLARPRIEPKTLRISSDLDGHIPVAENGAGKTFTDDSEVSDFLLRPLLTYITSQ
jgi:hypothetical protein